jgi:8-oxo-dGTP diphosphatase
MKREGEHEFLSQYRPEDFRRPSVAVDIVVLTLATAAELSVLLVRRNEHPFKGTWALPGGFLRVGPSPKEQGEDLDAAAVRELEEETGLTPDLVFLDQLHVFGKAGRDPRMRVVSVVYYALVPPDLLPRVRPGGDASQVRWSPVSAARTSDLAFDHALMIETATARVTAELETTAISRSLVGSTFTIPELRAAFESVSGKKLDQGNFRRKFNALVLAGVVERAPGKRTTASKPAAVYRFCQRSSA